jgi:hypothetical protein
MIDSSTSVESRLTVARENAEVGDSINPEIEQAAHALALDAAAAEVVGALEVRDIPCVLIKGPATVHWLYTDDPEVRPYADVDLLVDPSRFKAAENVLEALGFAHEHGDYRVDEQTWMHDSAWGRPGPPPAYVDLHRGFHGVGDWEAFWSVMDAHTDVIDVGGRGIRIPDVAGCALVVALHDSSTGRTERSTTDLRRAVSTFDEDVWREAARRAEDVDARPSFVLALTMDDDGRLLVERLGVPTTLPADVATRSLVASGVPAGQADRAWALQHRLGTAAGWRDKLRVLGAILFPPTEFLIDSRPMAGRGRLGLLAARILYPIGLVLRAPRILWLVLRGRRRAAGTRG